MKRIIGLLLLAVISSLHAASPPSVPIFFDNFESGTMALWTTTAANPLDPATPQNIVPVGGSWSALMNTSIDRMHHNLIADNGGAEVAEHTLFTCYIYDPGPTAPATRIFNEVRGYSGTGLPNGGTAADGALVQLFAIGKYNTVTLPGEVFSGTKYQGRAGFPTNAAAIVWFNLNGPGSPNRSVGWHRFDVERMPDGTTINFYVDGIMSRTVTNAVPASWDTVILGPGLGSTVGDAWIDGISVGRVDVTAPVINCPTNLIVVATSSSAGAIVNYPVTATDDQDTNPTITCTPPSGSLLPVGVTQVICTATDDAGNSSRCLFDVTVLPLRFEGFEHWSQGQAVLTPVSNRLMISNLGAGGNDGWRMDLRRVDGSLIQFVPYTNPNNTCTVANVEIELDGRAAQISSQILLGDSTATLRADFAALGSTESEVEVFDGNHRLLDTYHVANNAVIDVGSLFPAGCDPKTTVYSYFQDTNGVCWRLCKVGCVPCNVGTNCYAERVVCLRASAQGPQNIKLHAIEFRAQGAMETSSLIVEDVKFMKFGNEHHSVGNGLVNGDGGVIAIINEALLATDIPPAMRLEISPSYVWHSSRPVAPGVNGINLHLKPVDLVGGINPCVGLSANGMFNGLPAVQLGTAQLRKHATQKGPELSADFRSIGASMVSLEVLSRGQSVGDVNLPNGMLGDVTGSGKLIGVGDAQLSPGTFRFLWDAAMDLRAADGSVFKGDEFRMRAYDPQGQVQTVEMLALTAENIPEITILDETIEPLGEQFFPNDKIPPPTATWQTLPGETLQYPTPNQGGLALRNLRLSFFDTSFDPPKAGEQATKHFRCILDGEISRGFAWECIGLQGESQWRVTALQPPPDDGRPFEMEMLLLNVAAGPGLILRESPTRPSLGKAMIRPLSTGGDMISSFFDVFTEISLDGGQTWFPADVSAHMELAAYQSIRSTTPNLPPAGGEFDMQCPEVRFINGAVIRNVRLINLEQGPSMIVPLNQAITVPVNGAAVFEFSRDGQSFGVTSGQVQGTGRALHSFNYPESGDMSFFDTEMLGLQFMGTALPVPPAPIIVRKMPTALPGAGRSCLGRNEFSEYLIASFFDVRLEISLDGGQTFSPAIRPARFTLTNPNGNCLRIQCPPDIRVCACTEQGTPVSYTATAQSSCNTIPTIQCNPPSGTTFPVGSHTVTCVAKDSVGNSASCSFKVEVGLDSEPPRLVCPPNITNCVCSPNGGPINYTVTATDDCDTNVTIICDPPPGTILPPGVHTVTCRAIDDCNHVSSCEFRVFLRPDTEPPRLNCPERIEVCACSPNGTNVTYNVAATDDCDSTVTITCVPPSGSFFTPGTHTVTCRAEDDCGNKSECSFPVVVTVNRLAITCPPDITRLSCSNTPVVVNYTVLVSNSCPGTAGSCVVPDNGTGTATLPPNCPYVGEDKLMIIDGLPVGTTIELAPIFDSFVCALSPAVCSDCFVTDDCNPANGEILSYRSALHLTLDGTGSASGYHRTLVIPNVLHRAQDAPRTPGSPVQSFNADMLQIQGQLPPGDPDFDLLRITAGTDFGLPSPGHTTLTQVGSSWAVDSFFDITYRIDFVGHPGGPFAGRSGSTTGTIRIRAGGGSGATVVCNPPSGSAFPVGTTTVTCRATNECGSDTCQFKVTVVGDQEPPRIICPNGVAAWTCSNSTVVTYTVTATDDVDPAVSIVCNPPSGSTFPVGITTVTCVATDDCGKTDRCEFPVRVIKDTEPPTIICPDTIVVRTCRECAPVNYHVDARDDCDTNVTIICTPPPGTCFPIGTNEVRCVAIDDCGNRSECKFDIVVVREQGPPLTIRRGPNGTVIICWPVTLVAWQLQCARSLNPPILWEPVNAQGQPIGNEFCVTIPANDRHRFYRLFRPCDQ